MESGAHTYEHLSEDITVVRVAAGELDGSTVPPLRKLLFDLVNHGRFHLVVDLTAVDHLGSIGVGALVGALKRIRAHDGGLAVVAREERVLKMFRISGLTKVFPIFGTVFPAIEYLGRNAPKAHV
ncbi:STAS domain-containing protein [Streptomyces sp. Je 1-332]|uniref:STAS domain-containing protein n=1 Tax=Streptomyces sp. Je 1-332 TaxID=3231270 RepID=UPI003457C520